MMLDVAKGTELGVLIFHARTKIIPQNTYSSASERHNLYSDCNQDSLSKILALGRCREIILNGHSLNILHMKGIADKLKRAGITQNEMKSGEGYSK